MNIQNRLADLVDSARAFQCDIKSLENEKLMGVVSEDYKRSLKARALKNLVEVKKAYYELVDDVEGFNYELDGEDLFNIITALTTEVR